MSIGSIIYRILIGPLELFFEVVFVVADRHVTNPAYAIFFLSLAMNFLVLPLYRRADIVQAEARDRENAMAPWVKHIKKTFKGDERFMMLQALYKENNYKPTDSLKGSVSLLLEIPFFIAAYHFLSNLQTLKGISFGPITDLGAPDALLTIGATSINALPILMTIINVISAAIYMKGFPLKSKVQMYGIAAIFLVFLYKSPAGLVFYWTLNNLFSLLKNIFYKLPNPGGVFKVMASITGIVLLVIIAFIHPMPTRRAQAITIALLLCLQIPILKRDRHFTIGSVDERDTNIVFYSSAAFMTILTGVLIPSSIISDSTEEFISVNSYYSPYWYVFSTFLIAFGTFIVWFTIFYRLASKEGKQVFSLLMIVFAAAAVVNYMFFGKEYGNMSSTLVYDKKPVISSTDMLLNIAVICIAALLVILIFRKKTSVIKALSLAMCIALVVMSGMNLSTVHKSLAESADLISAIRESEPEISLSKNGKNVVVIMMDRQIGHFIPFIMHEKPELKEAFSGFAYYANSFSYGNFTNVGSPALFGGYDYVPAEMNKRSDLKLAEKHDEALKVMPKLFSDNGYEVSVINPPYAGYSWIPDLTIFDDIPGVKKSTTTGKFSLSEYGFTIEDEVVRNVRTRNFFLFGIFKSSPLILQPTLYAKGSYNAPKGNDEESEHVILSMTESNGMGSTFLDCYAALSSLPSITTVKDSDSNTFLMMSNDLTHEPMMLQEPSFTPSMHVDNSSIGDHYLNRQDDEGNILEIGNEYELIHYQTNVAAMLKLGEWLEWLKKQNVYDNTRIIIVSDHGRNIGSPLMPVIDYVNSKGEDASIDSCFFDCVLLAKDFDTSQYSTVNNLSSNADVPAIAVKDLVPEAKNPYTGNDIELLDDQDGDPEIICTFDINTNENNGNKFMPADWFTVRDSIYKADNWEYLGYR